eukprot:4008367-Amphidinium_carterae.1
MEKKRKSSKAEGNDKAQLEAFGKSASSCVIRSACRPSRTTAWLRPTAWHADDENDNGLILQQECLPFLGQDLLESGLKQLSQFWTALGRAAPRASALFAK